MDVLTCRKGFFNIKKNGQFPLFVTQAKFAHRPLLNQSYVGDTTKTEDSSAASHTSHEQVGTENIPHSTPKKKDVSHRTTQSALDVEVSSDFCTMNARESINFGTRVFTSTVCGLFAFKFQNISITYSIKSQVKNSQYRFSFLIDKNPNNEF